MDRKTLINVCGTGRSGSTMVDLMLGNDPRAFSLGEVYAWFRPFRSHHFKIICSCGQDDCPWDKIKLLQESEFHEKCFSILDVDILVDSSKNLTWVIDNNIWARNSNISIYNILLFKQPINFFYSLWKRGSLIKEARKSYIKYYKCFFETGIPFIALDYNKLVADPEKIMQKLCNLVGLSYFEGKERFWEKKHHHLFGSRGTRMQIEEAKSQIRKQEDYPKDFKMIIPDLQEKVANDQEMQDILAILSRHELMKMMNDESVIIKPFWYYLLKLKQQLQRYFPEKWKYNQ